MDHETQNPGGLPTHGGVPSQMEEFMKAYIDAFHAHDVERCMVFFDDDAVIDFQIGTFKGRKSIEDWHRERFAANLTLTRIDKTSINGDNITVDAMVSSNKLAEWKIKQLAARLKVRMENGKIKHAKMNARASNPFKLLHSD